jgi:hypothetical protein
MKNPADSLEALVDSLGLAQRSLLTAQTRAEFNDAFSAIILNTVRELQSSSKNLSGLTEDGISDVFKLAINGSRVLVVTREENSNGHADLTFKADLCNPPRKALGEAKIYKDYPWHEKGVKQLVEDYCTGSEERSLLLVYMTKPDIKGKMESLRSKLDENLPCSQLTKCDNHDADWSFLSSHTHSSGEKVEVWHLGCNLFHPKAVHRIKAVKGKPSRN